MANLKFNKKLYMLFLIENLMVINPSKLHKIPSKTETYLLKNSIHQFGKLKIFEKARLWLRFRLEHKHM